MRLDTKVTGIIFKNNGQQIPPDEFIVFRPADNALPATLDYYWTVLSDLGADQAQLDAVRALIERVRSWRKDHPERCKVPDVVPGELQTE